MHRQSTQRGFILLPVVLAITLIAAIAFLINTESAINVDMTASTTAAVEAEQVARSGLAHATWGIQNSGCAGDMGMMTVPFGQAGTDNYTATVTTPGGATTGYPDLVSDQDAWFRSDNITTNNGTNTTYHLRMESGNLEHAVVRFDLSSLPAGAQINSAVARFYIAGGKGHPEGPVTVHRATAEWTETGATWETMGDNYDSAVLHTIPAQPDAGDVWVTVNLTAQVQAWVNGGEPNYGIMLIPTGEGTHAEYISREGAASEQPRLDVIVGNGAATPATIQVTGKLAGNPSPANDITRTLVRTAVPAYQPPGTISLQLGTDPGEDGMPDSFYSARNYGGATYVQVNDNGTDWQQYPLIRFDLARLPHGAAVRSAQLELHLRNLNAPGTATIHQVARSWVEGTKSGTGTADGATWFTHDGTNPWTSPGGDINAPVVAETAIDGSETWVSWEIAPLVERWLAGEPNHGLMIRPADGLREAEFSSKEDTNDGVQPKLTITYACECGSPCLAPRGSGTILMVVVNPTTLVPADAYKKALFESWGYTVTALSESANQATYDTGIANSDVVYISETVNSTQVGSKLAAAPIGVVSEDGDYNGDLGFATGSGYAMGSAIDVTDTSHYITAVFPAGSLAIYDADMEGLTVGGTPAPDLQSLTNWGTNTGLAVLEDGAAATGGGSSAGRRVMLPLGRDASFNWEYLNANGQLLLHRALQWGMNADGGLPPKNLLLVVADAATPSTRSAGRKTLMESWGYTVTLIDDGDSQANFDTAMAANDVVYVTDTVSGPTLVDKVTNTTTPVVNEKGSKLGNFGFSSSESGTVNAAGFTSTDAAHYISEPFSGNPVTVFTSSLSMGVPDGTLAPDLQNVGEVSGTPALAALEDGATLWNGGSAPARRVHLPLGAAETTQLTADGETLMRRAIEWAEGAGGTGPAPSPSYNVLMIVGSLTLSSKDVGYKALIESWGHTVSLLDDGASQTDYDTAMDAADVILATGSASGPSMLDKATNTTTGLVNEVNGKIDNFGFSSSTSATANFDTFSTTSPTHYITEPFAGNAVTVFTSSLTNPIPGGTLAPDLQKVGFVSGTDALGTLDTGATRYDSNPSPGRRAHLPFTAAETTDMTADGKTILQRAIEWAAGADTAATGPIAHWKLDGGTTAVDSAGGHDGTLTNGPTWGTGQVDGSLSFDGSNDFVDVPYDAALSLTQGMTFTSWVNATSFGAGYQAIISTDVPGNGASNYWFGTWQGELVFGFWASSAFRTVQTSGLNLQPDTWYHLTASFDNATDQVLLYLDGTQVQTGSITYEPTPETANIWIGHSTDGEYWPGMLDDVRIYDRVLGGSEVTDLAAAGGGGGGPPPSGIVFEEFRDAGLSNDTILSISKPVGTTSGDLLVAAVATDGNTATSLAPPAGWNAVHVADQGGAVTFGVWWKLAGASEGTQYDFTWSSSEHAYGWVMHFTGHDPANPINASSNDAGSGTAPASPSVTTTVSDTLILRLGGFDDDDITTGDPGLSGHTPINMGDSGNGPATASGGSGYVLQGTVGASGTSGFTLTGSEEFVTVTIAIAPAP